MLWDDRTFFEQSYRVKDRQANSPTNGQWFSYSRRIAELNNFRDYKRNLELLRSYLLLPLSAKILIVGAGFGFLSEVMRDYGYLDITNIDNSNFISSRLPNHARFDTQANFRQGDVLGDVSSWGVFDFVISEGLISVFTYSERQAFYANCDSLSSNIIHLVFAMDNNPLYHTQSLQSWYLENPNHIWIDIIKGDKLGSNL